MANGPPTVDEVLIELCSHMDQGLGGNRLSDTKLAEWMAKHRAAIEKHLKKDDTDWHAEKMRVRRVAWKLGRVAAALADKQTPVPDWAADAARIAVKNDPACGGPRIMGGYCDF
jgi:hypothetical protein